MSKHLSSGPGPLHRRAIAPVLLILLSIFGINAAYGQSGDQLPAPWQAADIGAPWPIGYSLYTSSLTLSYGNVEGGTYNISGDGADIYGSSDQFHFVYQVVNGNTTIIARIVSQTNSNTWAKAGLMIRESMSASANFADIVDTPGYGSVLQFRNASNSAGGQSSGGLSAPFWMKLVRSGTTVTGYEAPDVSNQPGTWTQVGSPQPIATGSAYVGFCVTSHNEGTISTAAFDSVSLTNSQAVASDTLVDSIGVNTHFGWWSDLDNNPDPYTSNYSAVKSLLIGSRVRHLRDIIGSTVQPAQYTYFNQDLAAFGVKTTAICDVPYGTNQAKTYITGTILPTVEAAGVGNVVDALEGPNEPDGFWPANSSHGGTEYVGAPFSTGPDWFLSDLYYNSTGNSATSSLPIYSMPMGGTGFAYPAGTLSPICNFGNFHIYPNWGNANSWSFAYDTIPNYFANGSQPSNRTDEFAYAFDTYQPQTGTHPMVATEAGYYTGSSQGSISQLALAKYVPRIFTEFYRRGIRHTFLYDFLDDGSNATQAEQNYGLVYNNLSPKPAYTALQSLIALLADPGFSFTPGSLTYSVSASDPGYNYRTWYVHNLLLERHDGTFFLCVWYEISDSSNADTGGNILSGTERDISPPLMPTVVSLPGMSGNVTVYTYNQSTWQFTATQTPIVNGTVSLSTPDTVTVIAIPPSKQPIANGTYTLAPACATGSRLDASGWGTSNPTKAQIWQSTGGTNQKWVFTYVGGGWYSIQPSYVSGMSLDVNGAGSTNGTLAQLWTSNGSSAQYWQAIPVTGGAYKFSPMCAPGFDLDVSGGISTNGTQVDIWQDNGSAAQEWTLGTN